MRKLPARFCRQLKSNRGAGIITVLVAMMLIAMLGSALLFTSYTGFKIKISDRGGKESFYDASAAMDEIKSGVQQAVTEVLATAYTKVLSEYANGEKVIHEKFATTFMADLMSWKTDSNDNLFKSPSTYSTAALRSFVSNPPSGSDVEIAGGDCDITLDPAWLRLEDISVTYTTASGYQSNVTSDILITMPDFKATTSTVVSSGLPSFALVVDGTLSSNTNSPEITGNAYAGEISLTAKGNKLTYTGGTLVCAGTIAVSNAVLQTNTGTEVWAENVSLGEEGKARLFGRTFMANDLVLAGKGASAELKGSYFGFGSGSTADTSSAMIANGKETTLNIAGLERLVLAGVGFIKTNDAGISPDRDVRTGESISAKSNQLAYLIDKSCITATAFFDANKNGVFDEGETPGSISGSNPFVFTGDTITYTVAFGEKLWGTEKTLASYGITGNASIIPVHKNLPGTGGYKIAYYYLNFTNQERANEYFRDYFSANPQRIEEYIRVYVDLSNQSRATNASGNTLYETPDGGLNLLPGTPGVNLQGRSAEFSNRCQTLNPGKPSPGNTPFSYFVNQDAINSEINAGDSKEFKLPGDSKTVAKVIRGNHTITSTEKAKVIIATGDVTVSSEYSGLILSGGNVTVNGKLTYALSDVENIIYKAVDGTKPLSSYLLNTVIGDDAGTGFISSWDLDLLVAYENWSKN